MGDDVIELSVAETNKLRAELGLAPLRETTKVATAAPTNGAAGGTKEMLELSVEETNKLRASLGLKPLSVKKEDVHKPAVNDGEQKELQERLDKEKLKRQVQQGITSTFGSDTLGNSDGDTQSWAQKMRGSAAEARDNGDNKSTNTKKKKKKKKSKATVGGVIQNYDDADLEGINVSHAVSDFEAGSTTILTLADTSLLKQSDVSSKVVGLNDLEDEQRLENVELTGTQDQKNRLRQKRQVEMGMGRAGGYAGYDDDEFEELGGAQGPSRLARGQDGGTNAGGDSDEQKTGKKRRGFQIGSSKTQDDGEEDASDLFAHHKGKAVSLEQSVADVAASDFMTTEEDAALNPKKKKKEAKFKKKKKKKDKKNKRKIEDDIEEEREPPAAVGNILDDLEQSAVVPSKERKRRRSDSEAEEEGESMSAGDATKSTEQEDAAKRRSRFDEIMEKGNAQTKAVFSKPVSSQKDDNEMLSIDEEPDDNFLHEALAKARRLKKLREMSKPKGGAADAVAQAVQDSKLSEQANSSNTGGSGLSFAVDETREFTRALRARTEQAERQKAKKQLNKPTEFSSVKKEETPVENSEDVAMEENSTEGSNKKISMSTTTNEDMAELAKQIEQDDEPEEGGMANTSSSAAVGRGMAGFVSMLRQTGEISGRNAGREEMRGRAKDERTYDDYQPLNLSEVVRIGQNATDKDRELASREIKLDYRDEHGRLLTRKEAYRNLCYQFHGHGSSAKNEEKRLRQVEREQAEARLASHQGGGAGSLGALKATQKATGKAFVVHKT